MSANHESSIEARWYRYFGPDVGMSPAEIQENSKLIFRLNKYYTEIKAIPILNPPNIWDRFNLADEMAIAVKPDGWKRTGIWKEGSEWSKVPTYYSGPRYYALRDKIRQGDYSEYFGEFDAVIFLFSEICGISLDWYRKLKRFDLQTITELIESGVIELTNNQLETIRRGRLLVATPDEVAQYREEKIKKEQLQKELESQTEPLIEASKKIFAIVRSYGIYIEHQQALIEYQSDGKISSASNQRYSKISLDELKCFLHDDTYYLLSDGLFNLPEEEIVQYMKITGMNME